MDTLTLARIAHELRTPLTLIRSTLQMIEAELPETKSLKHWSQLNEDVRDMGELITSLTADPMDTPEPVDLLRLLPGLLDNFLLQAGDDTLTITLTSTPEARAPASHFLSNRTHLKQIFTNLIKNALESTEGQSVRKVEVMISLRPDPDILCICIRDNGPGIPAEILPHLYTSVLSGKPAGQGIGLTIVHSLVLSCGGRMDVESTDQGTTFLVYLPFADTGSA